MSTTNQKDSDRFREKMVREDMMIQAKELDENNTHRLIAMKEVIAMAVSIEEAYQLARLSEEPFVEMYVDHLASQLK
jgi:hypothetical protein